MPYNKIPAGHWGRLGIDWYTMRLCYSRATVQSHFTPVHLMIIITIWTYGPCLNSFCVWWRKSSNTMSASVWLFTVRTYVRGTTLPTGDCEGAEGLPRATEEQRGSPHLDECWHRELRETAKAPKVTLSFSSFCNHAVVEDNLGVNLLTKSFLLQVFKSSCIFFETIVFALTAFRSG